jgi:hypothetical protein
MLIVLAPFFPYVKQGKITILQRRYEISGVKYAMHQCVNDRQALHNNAPPPPLPTSLLDCMFIPILDTTSPFLILGWW